MEISFPTEEKLKKAQSLHTQYIFRAQSYIYSDSGQPARKVHVALD